MIELIKKDYAKKIGDKLNINYNVVSKCIDEFLEELVNEICDNDKVSISNFGTFTKTLIKAKNQFSPIDGSSLNNSYYRLTFTCSKELINKLKNK